jgi:hypothetical protein
MIDLITNSLSQFGRKEIAALAELLEAYSRENYPFRATSFSMDRITGEVFLMDSVDRTYALNSTTGKVESRHFADDFHRRFLTDLISYAEEFPEKWSDEDKAWLEDLLKEAKK